MIRRFIFNPDTTGLRQKADQYHHLSQPRPQIHKYIPGSEPAQPFKFQNDPRRRLLIKNHSWLRLQHRLRNIAIRQHAVNQTIENIITTTPRLPGTPCTAGTLRTTSTTTAIFRPRDASLLPGIPHQNFFQTLTPQHPIHNTIP